MAAKTTSRHGHTRAPSHMSITKRSGGGGGSATYWVKIDAARSHAHSAHGLRNGFESAGARAHTLQNIAVQFVYYTFGGNVRGLAADVAIQHTRTLNI